jgi:predicted transcriptional regulator
MKKNLRPTEAELEILHVLWEHGPCPVRLVNEKIAEKKEVGYTTTLKLMQIMVEKGLASRDTSTRKHLYMAEIPRSDTQDHLLNRLADMAFGGSPVRLAMKALDEQSATKDEIKELRRLLDNLENDASND